jgi:hypothetical protein
MPPRGECPEQGSATGGHAAAGGDIGEVAAVEKPRSGAVGGRAGAGAPKTVSTHFSLEVPVGAL